MHKHRRLLMIDRFKTQAGYALVEVALAALIIVAAIVLLFGAVD